VKLSVRDSCFSKSIQRPSKVTVPLTSCRITNGAYWKSSKHIVIEETIKRQSTSTQEAIKKLFRIIEVFHRTDEEIMKQ